MIKKMEQKELRPNSLFDTVEGKLFLAEIEHPISQGDFWLAHEFSENLADHLKPIPITEEWLLRFGFEVQRPLGEDAFNCDAIKGNIELNKNISNNHAWVYRQSEKNPFVFLEFVHQLQNLYFALTGEELELK